MSTETESESNVFIVRGQMNPAIHHPTWYVQEDLLENESLDEALSGSICLPQLARFRAPAFEIQCRPDAWILTCEAAQRAKAIEVGSRIFDELLKHTPVTAIGVNFLIHRRTESESVARTLAQWVEGLDICGEPPSSATLSYSIARGDMREVNVRVEPSINGAALVYVDVNVHNTPPPAQGLFNIGPILTSSIEEEEPLVNKTVANLLTRFGDS